MPPALTYLTSWWLLSTYNTNLFYKVYAFKSKILQCVCPSGYKKIKVEAVYMFNRLSDKTIIVIYC